jgi:hypothetical protein
MTGQNETLKRALEALAEICGPVSVNLPESEHPVAPKAIPTVDSVQGMADYDHEVWARDFGVWMKARCTHREGKDDWGGVGAMVVDFGEWAVSHHSVPCTRLVLEALLRDAGFAVVDGMVGGLVLLTDLLTAFPEATAERLKDWRL